MIRLLMRNTRWPPLGLGLFRIASAPRSRSWRGLSAIVRMSHLLAWLDEFDKRLCDHAAVDLLEVLQSTLVVFGDLLRLPNAKRHHIITTQRKAITMGVTRQATISD